MTGRPFIVDRKNPHWRDVLDRARDFAWEESANYPVRVQIGEYVKTRSLEANAAMWAALHDVSEQVEWPVDGKMQRLEPAEWKDIFTAGLKKHQRVAAGMDGGFVMLGTRTSRMSKREMSDLLDLIAAFGAERGVAWSGVEA